MAKKTQVIYHADSQSFYLSAEQATTLYIKGINQEDIQLDSFRTEDGFLKFTIKETLYVVERYTNLRYIKTDNSETYKTELLDIISDCLVNNPTEIKDLIKPYYNSKKLTVTGTNYNDTIDYSESGYEPKGKNNIKKEKGLTIKGGNGNDTITGTDFRDTIIGGNGNDTINSDSGNDTITGGKGVNTIVINNTAFGNDVVNLTKGEELVLDFTKCTDITKLSDIEYRISGKNLIITVPDKGTLTLKNYTKNILKSLSFNISGQPSAKYNNSSELAEAIVFDYNNSNLDKKRVLTGTGYNDRINVQNTTNKTYTINAGNGKNDITVSGGKNVINSGNNDDTIAISGAGNYTVNAGGGENTITIDNSYEFGTVVISEQKLNAVNNLVLIDELLYPEYCKKGNDLYIEDNNDTVILKNYYANFPKKSTINFNIGGEDIDLESVLSDETMEITGSGRITGTKYDDIITITGKNSTTINAGKGDDIIGSSRGNRTIYLAEGDGNDIVEAGKGTDIVKFAKGTNVKCSLEYDLEGNPSRLLMEYGTNGDSITFEDYNSKKKIYYYIGNKKYSVASSFKKGNTIKINEYSTSCEGSDKNDTIKDSLQHTSEDSITIYGKGGDDYIDAHHDVVYGGEGNDYIHAINSIVYGEGGNDTIINYGALSSYYATGQLYGNDGNDTIVNNQNATTACMMGGNGDDTLTNDGAVTHYNNNILYSLNGEAGNDTITNNGSAYSIEGGDGNDIIINSGTVSNGIRGGAGDDIITTNINSTGNTVFFANNDGNDTLYLNASANYLYFSNNNISSYLWDEDDFIIKYNNDKDSVRIKDYDPYSENTIVYANSSNLAATARNTKKSKHYTDKDENIINNKTKHCDIYLCGGNDSYLNNGTVSGSLFGDNGNDTLTNNGTVTETIYGGEGEDIITDNGTTTGGIRGGADNDVITVTNNVSDAKLYFSNGDGNDTLYLNGNKNYLNLDNDISINSYSWDGDDLIINYNNNTDSIRIKDYNPHNGNTVYIKQNNTSTALGTPVEKNINGTDDADNIVLNGFATTIHGNGGKDIITNNGRVSYIYGDAGDDEITINGITSEGVYGGTGDDIITVTNNVNYVHLFFNNGDGNDTLYLNGKNHYLDLNNNIVINSYAWDGDDLIIYYNNSTDSIRIKNYDPYSGNAIYITEKNKTTELGIPVSRNINGTDDDDNLLLNGYATTVHGYGGNDIITSNNVVENIYGEGDDDKITNNGTVINNINCGGGTNEVINNGTVKNIVGSNGADTVTNYGTVNTIKTWGNNDTIINEENATAFLIHCGDGKDTIINNGTIDFIEGIEYGEDETPCIDGYMGNSQITNNGTINGSINGSSDKDVIVNNGTVKTINGNNGDDEITNNGYVTEKISCGAGKDTIVNKGNVVSIDSGSNSSKITNDGTISGGITCSSAYTTIQNNGTINGYIYSGTGGTVVNYGNNSSDLKFYIKPDENPASVTINLNKEETSIKVSIVFNSSVSIKTCKYFSGTHDVDIRTENGSLVWIKNYSHTTSNVYIQLPGATTTKSLAQYLKDIGEIPAYLGSAREDLPALTEQVTAFTTSNSSDIATTYETPDVNDISVVMSEYIKNQ